MIVFGGDQIGACLVGPNDPLGVVGVDDVGSRSCSGVVDGPAVVVSVESRCGEGTSLLLDSPAVVVSVDSRSGEGTSLVLDSPAVVAGVDSLCAFLQGTESTTEETNHGQ